MPFDSSPQSPSQRVAVIGTGVAGLSAAWLLSSCHDVTVFEKADRIGGHVNTVEVPGPDGPIAVDTGFIVYNDINYPNLVELFRHLGVATRPSTMSFSVSIDEGAFEYSGSGLAGLLVQPSNLLRPGFWRMIADILRFYRRGADALAADDADCVTLGGFLKSQGYSGAFVDRHLLPMAAAIWSTTAGNMLEYPAFAFLRFFSNHGLMKIVGRPQWRTVCGGSATYVRALTAAFAGRIRRSAGIRALQRRDDGVVVEDRTGTRDVFDHVVVACHADEALGILDDADSEERRLLGAFRYSRNHAVLHRDVGLMPRRRRAWSSWNYISRGGGDDLRLCVSYWMNSLQGLDPRVPLFVTLNPLTEPASGTVIAEFEYDHPSYDLASLAAQRRLWDLQGRRRTWFCGSYFGAGFHEDALQSGLAAAEALGSERRPWSVPHASDRIVSLGRVPGPLPTSVPG